MTGRAERGPAPKDERGAEDRPLGPADVPGGFAVAGRHATWPPWAPSRLRTRAAFLGAVMVFFVGWAGVLAVLLKRGNLAAEPTGRGAVHGPPATAAPATLAEAPPAVAAPRSPPRVRALVVEHDDMSLQGTVRHLIRATVPAGLGPEALRRCIDLALDEERLMHPQVDSVGIYLYEEHVYARYTGRATPLAAAAAFGVWAPGGEWTNPGRSVSGLDNRITYNLPARSPAK